MSAIPCPSDQNTRLIRTNTKGIRVKVPHTKSLLACPELIGQSFKYLVPGEFAAVLKTVTITELFPHMALATYTGGLENQHELRIGLSTGDLIERGVLTFKNGYPEVVA